LVTFGAPIVEVRIGSTSEFASGFPIAARLAFAVALEIAGSPFPLEGQNQCAIGRHRPLPRHFLGIHVGRIELEGLF
jgi:hypothetical protein